MATLSRSLLYQFIISCSLCSYVRSIVCMHMDVVQSLCWINYHVLATMLGLRASGWLNLLKTSYFLNSRYFY